MQRNREADYYHLTLVNRATGEFHRDRRIDEQQARRAAVHYIQTGEFSAIALIHIRVSKEGWADQEWLEAYTAAAPLGVLKDARDNEAASSNPPDPDTAPPTYGPNDSTEEPE